jgi:hypothetical protein
MWNNRLLLFVVGLLLRPVVTWQAFSRGRRQRNVYRLQFRDVLARDVDEMRRYVAAG